jgi:hypothetical protein
LNIQGIINFCIESGYLLRLAKYSTKYLARNGKVMTEKREMNHVEELVDDSFVHQVTQDCSLPSFHQSLAMGFDKLSRLLPDP